MTNPLYNKKCKIARSFVVDSYNESLKNEKIN